ncbi:MAG: multiheme c-type cytochrome [Planctomycetota bacterium]
MESGPTQAVLPLVGLVAEKVIRDRYIFSPLHGSRSECSTASPSNERPDCGRGPLRNEWPIGARRGQGREGGQSRSEANTSTESDARRRGPLKSATYGYCAGLAERLFDRRTVSDPGTPNTLARNAVATMVTLVMAVPLVAQETRDPVFVGAKQCAKCHQGPGFGYQHCRFLLSGHSRAHASLAMPEAKEIARLSGIPQEPQKSPMCLGCHATGNEAEEWERDETFHMEDGVQCEKCHGPGSEYMDEAVMVDREAARAAGLVIPDKDDCMNCHKVKGSHVAVLQSPKFDVEEAWNRLAHPTPGSWKYMEPAELPGADAEVAHQYIGSIGCAECHQGPEMGYQYSKWRMGPHARAYATLGTERARKIAKDMEVEGDPLKATACLKCHATAHHAPAGGTTDAYEVHEGVGCESCHGAGSDFAVEAIMRDKPAAVRAGLKEPGRDVCARCHEDAHGKPFDFDAAFAEIAHPLQPESAARKSSKVTYKTPLRLALSPNGEQLYVTCEASHAVIVVDTVRHETIGEITVGHHPTGVTFHPSGKKAYVTNRLDDTLSVIDVAKQDVIATVEVGDEPHGVRTDGNGDTLYVVNSGTNDLSVIDTETLTERKRLEAGRRPWSLALSPDETRLCVTNALSHYVPFRTPSQSELTMIDVETSTIADRPIAHGANLLMGICWHPSGDFAISTVRRTKNLVPMTRLLQGWTLTNGLVLAWRDGRVDQVLLDEPNLCFPDPTGIAMTPDGRLALVTSSGSDRVAVVDVPKLRSMLEEATEHERKHVFPNHLGKPTEFVLKHLPTENSPRGVVITPNGKTAFVANALDDSLTVIDVETLRSVKRIDLDGPRKITKTRYGERLFHNADITFQRQFTCHTCHPDGHIDGLTYDIEPDGIGANPVDNRTLRGILDTAPFKWEGTNPSLQRQCGPRLAVFFTRIQPFTPEELEALDRYICTIPRPPNRYRPFGAELTEAQHRGKKLFDRKRTNDGGLIPKEDRCVTCHPPPLYTDRNVHDVGTQMKYDHESEFDVPHLNNIYGSAPYLHNGIAETLEEIWTRFNPNDEHGVTNDMTKDQLNDLIEYLKTL